MMRRMLFLTVLGAGKSETQVPAEPVPGEGVPITDDHLTVLTDSRDPGAL